METELLKGGGEGELKGCVDGEALFAYVVSALLCSLLLSPLYRFSLCLSLFLSPM